MKLFISLFFVLAFSSAEGQINIVPFQTLKERIHNTSDTTYIVNFWATWCKPCVAELPEFLAFEKENIKTPVKLLLVSFDFKSAIEKKIIPFIQQYSITSEVLMLTENDYDPVITAVSTQWSGAIPATWLVYKQKELFHEGALKHDDLEQFVQSLKK